MMKEGWKYKKLGEVCEIFDKRRKPVTKSARTNGVYPYYGATGIQDYVADYIFDGRFVLIGEDGAKWGACENTAFIIEGKSWVNNHAHIIKFDSNIIDSFAVYFLNFSNLDSFISGAVVRKLTQASMKNIVLPLPPLTQQQSIVAELDKINEIIDMKKAQLKDLDLLAQSIFYDMFGDPIENSKGWEVKRWEDIFDTKLGKMLDKAKQDVSGKELPYLANYNVKWGYFDLENLRTMFFSNTEIDKFSLKRGDLLLCEGGESGRCAIWNNTDRQILFQKAIHRARLKNNQVADVVYIRYFMEYFRLAGGLKDYLSKATIEHLTGEKLRKVKLPLPPLSLQQSFASKIQSIESQKSAIKQSLAEVETLLASRMDYWFN